MKFALCFTNFGPYHLARLRALAAELSTRGDRLIAYEVAGTERRYPWCNNRSVENFDWTTLFPNQPLEAIAPEDCHIAMLRTLDHDRPDAVGSVGYVRPESMTAARWARCHGVPSILMPESQAIDRKHVWWKELIKRRRIQSFDTALVGGNTHRAYLVQLGMPSTRIALGYNAVDNAYFRRSAQSWRQHPEGRSGLPAAPYFLTVCRFVPEKNLIRLIEAFARYHAQCDLSVVWHLVLCGDGPLAPEIKQAIAQTHCAAAIHCPGFLQSDTLPRWYAHAGAFILASLSEPWGLVVNEAAASSLPLLVSSRAGCAGTLIPAPDGTTGSQFDPFDVKAITNKLAWIASLADHDRRAMGERAAEIVSHWGPRRFAQGALEALNLARVPHHCRGRAGLKAVKTR
jgi:glycosyltransferase involved in cell wall biosynthesis